jgi:hypothetical protein
MREEGGGRGCGVREGGREREGGGLEGCIGLGLLV